MTHPCLLPFLPRQSRKGLGTHQKLGSMVDSGSRTKSRKKWKKAWMGHQQRESRKSCQSNLVLKILTPLVILVCMCVCCSISNYEWCGCFRGFRAFKLLKLKCDSNCVSQLVWFLLWSDCAHCR